MEHPVIKAIFSDLQRTAFNLSQAIHWRGKIPSNFHPYTRNDLVHDISEIFGLYDQLNIDTNQIQVVDVSDMDTWAENTDRFEEDDRRDTYDVRSTIHLSGSYDEPMIVKGGFDEPEDRRYFLWVDDNRNVAYFANTVTRDHLTPFSAKVTGQNNIRYLVHKCIEGALRNDTEFEEVLDQVDATILERNSEAKQTDAIANSLLSGEEGPATLQQAYEIESLIKRVYEHEGNLTPYQI